MADATATPQQSGSSNPYAPAMQDLLSYKQAYDAGKPVDQSLIDAAYSKLGGDNSVFHTMSTQDMQNFMQQQNIPPTSSAPQTGTTGTTSSQPSTPAPSSGGGSSLPQQMLQAAQNPTSNVNPYAGGETTNIQTPTGTFKAPEQNGKSYMTSAQLAEAGLQYTKDPNSGILTINGTKINPVGYDPSGNPIYPFRASLNAAGVQDNNIKYDPNSDTVSYTLPTANAATNVPGSGQTPQPSQQLPPMPQYNSPLPGFMGQMPQAPNIMPYQAPDLSQYYNNLTPLQQFNPDWNQYYQQAYNQLDPAVQAQIQTLNTKQGQDITKADEGLNAKGIFNSGIAVQMENQIRANTNDQVAKVLMTEQGNLAKVAQQLYMDAFKQWDAGNTQALKNNQMWLTQAMNQAKLSFDEWSKTQGLTMQQYQYALKAWDDAANLALKDAQFQAQQQLNYEKMAVPYQFQTANNQATDALNLYKFNNLSADQQANLNLNQYKFNNLSADQQATLGLNAAKVFGFDQNGRPTLDTWKMLGYVQMPDGSLKPTETATKDQQTYALNLAKALGYVANPDGSITPTEKALNDQATQALNRDKLVAQINQWAQTDKINSSKLLLSQQTLTEKVNYDQSMIDKASNAAQDAVTKMQLDGLKTQLSTVGKIIAAKQAGLPQGQQLPNNDPDIQRYNSILDQVNTLTQSAGK